MRPYQHAVSSAATFGGRWEDYLAVHEFIDSTKAPCPDIRHRLILHSVNLGASLARLVFPEFESVEQVVVQHVVEDLGEPRTMAAWLRHCRTERFPKFFPGAMPIDPEQIIADEAARVTACYHLQVRKVWEVLALPIAHAPSFGVDALCLLCNSFGPSVVRRVLGPPTQTDGQFFEPALCAERMIYRLYRALPPMTVVVQSLSSTHQSRSRA